MPDGQLLTLVDGPVSGLGDRFAAWLALFALARIRNDSVLITPKRWARNERWVNHTRSGEANQIADVRQALDCFVLPTHVLRAIDDSDGEVRRSIVDVRFQEVFAPRVVLPRPTPGMPQWALPKLAAGAFSKRGMAPNLTLATYLTVLRRVSAELAPSDACTPPDAHLSLHGSHRDPRNRTLSSLAYIEVSSAQETQRAQEAQVSWRPASMSINIALHLRRGDAWRSNVHSSKGVRSITDKYRDAFENATQQAVLTLVAALDSAHGVRDAGATMATAPGAPADVPTEGASSWEVLVPPRSVHSERIRLQHGIDERVVHGSTLQARAAAMQTQQMPVHWLVLSDDSDTATAYRRLIRAASTTGQRASSPPEGFTVWSFLAMRHVSGIVQSSTRQWSSFSSVPAIMNDVPIYGVAHNKWGVLPHVDCATVEQFQRGEEVAFVHRLLSGRRNCSASVGPARRVHH